MRAAAILLAAVVIAGCGGDAGPPSGKFQGLITKVSQESVTVRSADDAVETFVNEAGDVPVEHLKVHRDDKLPVVVQWEREDGKKVAKRIEDAPQD